VQNINMNIKIDVLSKYLKSERVRLFFLSYPIMCKAFVILEWLLLHLALQLSRYREYMFNDAV
jgi:hypothetical protein